MYPLTPMSFIKIFISEVFSFAFPEVNSIEPIVSRTRSTYLRDKADLSHDLCVQSICLVVGSR